MRKCELAVLFECSECPGNTVPAWIRSLRRGRGVNGDLAVLPVSPAGLGSRDPSRAVGANPAQSQDK